MLTMPVLVTKSQAFLQLQGKMKDMVSIFLCEQKNLKMEWISVFHMMSYDLL